MELKTASSIFSLPCLLLRITGVWANTARHTVTACPPDSSSSPSSLVHSNRPVAFHYTAACSETTAFLAFDARQAARSARRLKNSLMEYWSGIVRQAEMTKLAHEDEAARLLCIFCRNQHCKAKRCVHQSGATATCHHRGVLWSRGSPMLSKRACAALTAVMELSNLWYHSTWYTSPLSNGVCVLCHTEWWKRGYKINRSGTMWKTGDSQTLAVVEEWLYSLEVQFLLLIFFLFLKNCLKNGLELKIKHSVW